jgi:hypothetical protein
MDAVVAGLLDQGILGLMIVGLGFSSVKLWSKYDEIQEKRIAESREIIKAVEQNTNTLDILVELMRDRKAG